MAADPVSAITRRSPFDGGSGYILAGGTTLDLETLNARLEARQYPTFPEEFLTIGGGGHVLLGRFILGGEGHGLITRKRTTADRVHETSLEGGYGLLNIGYRIVAAPRFSLYPLLGLGGGGFQLRIRDRRDIAFDELLQEPGRQAQLDRAVLLAQLGLGFDTLIPLASPAGGRVAGLVIGLRGGYTFSTHVGDWTEQTESVAAGPALDLTGPFVRLTLGGGVASTRQPGTRR